MVDNFQLDKSVSSSLLRITCSSLNVHSKYFFGLNRLPPVHFFQCKLGYCAQAMKSLYHCDTKCIQLLFDIFCYDSRMSLWSMYLRPSRKQSYFFGSCLDGVFKKKLLQSHVSAQALSVSFFLLYLDF